MTVLLSQIRASPSESLGLSQVKWLVHGEIGLRPLMMMSIVLVSAKLQVLTLWVNGVQPFIRLRRDWGFRPSCA